MEIVIVIIVFQVVRHLITKYHSLCLPEVEEVLSFYERWPQLSEVRLNFLNINMLHFIINVLIRQSNKQQYKQTNSGSMKNFDLKMRMKCQPAVTAVPSTYRPKCHLKISK